MQLNAASEKKLRGVKPDLVNVVRRAASITTIPFQIVQGNRTQAEQNAIYAQGRTKPGPIVTWTRNSRHIGGRAVDFAALINDKIDWNAKNYPPIARAFKTASEQLGIGIEWGGDWKTKDWGHIQLTGVNTKPVLKTLKEDASPKYGLIDSVVSHVVGNSVEPPDSGLSNVQQTMNFFDDLGLKNYQAAAIAGQGLWESGGNRTGDIITTALGDNGHAYGGWQWNTRWKDLIAFCLESGLNASDIRSQLGFIEYEFKTTEKRAYEWLLKSENVEQATAAIISYLRPSGFYWPKKPFGWPELQAAAEKAHAYSRRLSLAKTLTQEN